MENKMGFIGGRIHNYRTWILDYIKENNIDVSSFDMYQFGIYSGNTYVYIFEEMANRNIMPNKVWGFDSFEGLPNAEARWKKGQFNAKEFHKNDNIESIIKSILDRVTPIQAERTKMIPGFFKDVLTTELAGQGMKQASWIDVDVDVYSSTVELLDFMVSNNLVRVGTIISYDDWSGTEEYKGGESLAHKEFCENHGIKCKEIFCKIMGGRMLNKVFEVEKI